VKNLTLMTALRRSGNVSHAAIQMTMARSIVKSAVLNYERIYALLIEGILNRIS
jgi:hypothetical protein